MTAEQTSTSGPVNSGISVRGVGSVTAIPDRLSIDIGVSVMSETVEQALARAGAHSQGLLTVFESFEIPERQSQTGQLSVHPQWSYRGDQQHLVGYQVSTSYSVKAAAIDQVGPLITAAADVVGDDLMVNSIGWSLEDDTTFVAAAREAAYADALARAQHLADLSGVELGSPVWVSEDGAGGPPVPLMSRAPAAEAASLALQPGTATVQVILDVVFAISS